MNEQQLVDAIRSLFNVPAWEVLTEVMPAYAPNSSRILSPRFRTSYNAEKEILLVEEVSETKVYSDNWKIVETRSLPRQAALFLAVDLTRARQAKHDEITSPFCCAKCGQRFDCEFDASEHQEECDTK